MTAKEGGGAGAPEAARGGRSGNGLRRAGSSCGLEEGSQEPIGNITAGALLILKAIDRCVRNAIW